MARGLIPFDKRQLGQAPCLTGIDEAGRGALAGPVVAAAVCCPRDFYQSSWCRRNGREVDDSKRLKASQRALIVERFSKACREKWIHIAIGTASVEEIEKHNIYGATTLAMRRALERVRAGEPQDDLFSGNDMSNGRVLIDGKPIRAFEVNHEGVVHGDRRSFAIALAGIHAKEFRDSLMRELAEEYPGYGFERHKGYGTQDHLDSIRRVGPGPCHRPSFLRKFHDREKRSATVLQDSLFESE